jgi:anti-anti-sigma factor
MARTIRVRTVGASSDIALITIRGSLDTMSAYQLELQGNMLLNNGIYRCIINLEQLDYVSSSGIEALHRMAQQLRQRNGIMMFTHVPDKILRLFEMIGVAALFQIRSTSREAMRELEHQPAQYSD